MAFTRSTLFSGRGGVFIFVLLGNRVFGTYSNGVAVISVHPENEMHRSKMCTVLSVTFRIIISGKCCWNCTWRWWFFSLKTTFVLLRVYLRTHHRNTVGSCKQYISRFCRMSAIFITLFITREENSKLNQLAWKLNGWINVLRFLFLFVWRFLYTPFCETSSIIRRGDWYLYSPAFSASQTIFDRPDVSVYHSSSVYCDGVKPMSGIRTIWKYRRLLCTRKQRFSISIMPRTRWSTFQQLSLNVNKNEGKKKLRN